MKFKVKYSQNETREMTLKEIADLHIKTIAAGAMNLAILSKGKGRADFSYERKLIPEKIKKKITWTKLSKEDLLEAGFREWSKESGVLLCPIYLWDLIPEGTRVYSILEWKHVIKTKDMKMETVMYSLPYGFKRKD